MKKAIVVILSLLLMVTSVFALPYSVAKEKAEQGAKAGYNYAIALKNPDKDFNLKLNERGGMYTTFNEDWELISISSIDSAMLFNKYLMDREVTKTKFDNAVLYEFGRSSQRTLEESRDLLMDKDYRNLIGKYGVGLKYIPTSIWADHKEVATASAE